MYTNTSFAKAAWQRAWAGSKSAAKYLWTGISRNGNRFKAWLSRKYESHREIRRALKDQEHAVKVILYPSLYWLAVAMSGIPLILTYVAWSNGWGITINNVTAFEWWVLMLPMSIMVIAAGFKNYDLNRFIAVTAFGYAAKELKGGLKYIPPLLAKGILLPRGIQQDQYPGEPEQISLTPSTEKLQAGLVRPIAITTGGPEADEKLKDDSLNLRMHFDNVSFSVSWQVEYQKFSVGTGHEGLFEFLINVAGDTWEERRLMINKIMRDSGASELDIVMSQHSGAWAITHKGELHTALKDRLVREVQDLGITICGTDVHGIVAPPEVAAEVNKLSAVREQNKQILERAEATKQETIKKSEGDAQKRINLLEAEGLGMAAAAKPIGILAAEYRNGELAKEILGDKTVILGGNGIAEAVAIGKTVVEGMNNG